MNIEKKNTFYTAVGHFRRKTDDSGHTYPVILVNQAEYRVDMQEMAVWTVLNWRFLRLEQIEIKYGQLAVDLSPARQTLETCLNRLEMRGLIARGVGGTDFEALYELLGELYVVPVAESLSLRLVTFGKLLLDGVPFSKARQLFRKDGPSQREAQVLALSQQALLSTAELIKCAEVGTTDVSTDEKLMDALIDNDCTTSDSIAFEMLESEHCVPVTMAVANLYLRKQIVFARA